MNNSTNKDDSRESLKSNKFVSKIKNPPDVKRITFNPNDFKKPWAEPSPQDTSTYSNLGFPEKSNNDMSLDFGLISGMPISNHKLLQQNDHSVSGIIDHSILRESNEKESGGKNKNLNQNSFISNINRDKDASYIMMN